MPRSWSTQLNLPRWTMTRSVASDDNLPGWMALPMDVVTATLDGVIQLYEVQFCEVPEQ